MKVTATQRIVTIIEDGEVEREIVNQSIQIEPNDNFSLEEANEKIVNVLKNCVKKPFNRY